MDERVTAAIIGGGIVGSAAAYYLARRGIDVVLFEKSAIGSEASGATAGGVRQHGRAAAELPLAIRSIELWKTLHHELDADVEYTQSGHVRIAQSDDELPELEAVVSTGKAFGLDIDMISPGACREKVPPFRGAVSGGYFASTDGHANPLKAPQAFAGAARRLGARIVQWSPVARVEPRGAFDYLVHGRDASCRAKYVINAAGAWAADLARTSGVELPLGLRYWQAMVTERVPPLLGPVVSIKALPQTQVVKNLNLKQLRCGSIVISGAWEGEGGVSPDRKTVTFDGVLGSARDTVTCFPALRDVALLRAWTGLEATSPDSREFIGPVPSLPGYLIAAGFSGSGFALGPIVGYLLAELIDTGSASLDLQPFGFSRLGVKVAAS